MKGRRGRDSRRSAPYSKNVHDPAPSTVMTRDSELLMEKLNRPLADPSNHPDTKRLVQDLRAWMNDYRNKHGAVQLTSFERNPEADKKMRVAVRRIFDVKWDKFVMCTAVPRAWELMTEEAELYLQMYNWLQFTEEEKNRFLQSVCRKQGKPSKRQPHYLPEEGQRMVIDAIREKKAMSLEPKDIRVPKTALMEMAKKHGYYFPNVIAYYKSKLAKIKNE